MRFCYMNDDGSGSGKPDGGGGSKRLDKGVNMAFGEFLGIKPDFLNSFLVSSHSQKLIKSELPCGASPPIVFSFGIELPIHLRRKNCDSSATVAAAAVAIAPDASPDGGESGRQRVNEIDFFSDERRKRKVGTATRLSPDGDQLLQLKVAAVNIKKEQFDEAVNMSDLAIDL